MRTSRPFSETLNEVLKDPEQAALYLETCLEEGDMELFTIALKDVANAYGGMGYLSEVTHLNGNPRLDTLHKILGAMGLRIGITVQQSEACTQ